MRNVLIVVGALLVLGIGVGVWYSSTYNKLVTENQAVDAQWGQVQTQYQRRYDLIPNLVAATKGIFEQEKAVFDAIAQARTNYAGAATTDQKVAATGQVESALARLLVVVENYPELRS